MLHELALEIERFMFHSRRVFLAGCLVAAAETAHRVARSTESDELSHRVQVARAAVRSMIARFRQERTLGLLRASVVSRGQLTLLAPDRLRWELFAPDSVIYWVGPSGIACASARSRIAVDRPMAGPTMTVLDDLLLFLGGEFGKLEARYEIRLAPLAGGGIRMTNLPRDGLRMSALRRLEIDLASDLVSPRRLLLEETSTDRVAIDFEDVQVNVPVDPTWVRPSSLLP